MSSKNTHARHRATPTRPSSRMSGIMLAQGGAGLRRSAVVLIGTGLLLGNAVPAQAGAISSTPSTGSTANQEPWAATAGSSYTVKQGDTLSNIATQHGLALSTLLSLNNLAMDSVIYPGDRISVLVASGNASVTAQLPAMTLTGSTESEVTSFITATGSDRAESAPSSANRAILAAAQAQLGAVQDCTVLGEVALRAAGIQGVGDESPESLMAYATPVSSPEPGDFIYYADGGMGFSHNAVYIGNGQAIHSGWNGNQTVIESVDVGSGPVYYRVNA